jgi:hypothetical protein
MPGYHWEYVQGATLPKFADQLRLCYDTASNTAWLEMTGMEYLVNGSSGPGVVKIFIGAVKGANGWEPISAAKANSLPQPNIFNPGAARDSLAWQFFDTSKIVAFQQAIVREWSGFKTSKASDFAKGTTFGKSMTSASFVAKALKTGYDAVHLPMAAYSGAKVSSWSINDLKKYANKRHPGWKDAALVGFDAYAPNPRYESPKYPKDQRRATDDRPLTYIRSLRAQGHSGRFAYAAELNNLPEEFERVVCYGFRGDTRPPILVKEAGGFNPNYTRPDHIAMHEASKGRISDDDYRQREEGALDLQKFIQDQTFRGFVSTTKSVIVAKNFGTGYTGTSDGWVYVCFVEGGVHLPPATGLEGGHAWVLSSEQEISMPGLLEWEDVVGCRHVKRDGDFDGPVYLKQNLKQEDRLACIEIWDLLSGKSQG